MFKTLQKFIAFLSLYSCLNGALLASAAAPYDVNAFLRKNDPQSLSKDLIIKTITIVGNKYIGSEVLKNKLPFQVGTPLDTRKSSIAINNLYSLGAFKQVEIRAREEGTVVHLIIHVEEKKITRRLSIYRQSRSQYKKNQ